MQLDGTLRKGFRLGDWLVRPIEGVVVRANESRHLQPKTMDVLVTLAESSGQVLTRDELLSRVWGSNAVSDEPLTRCIHELRRALDDNRGEPTFIQTIPKRGYRLLAEVWELTSADEILLGHTEPGVNPLRQVTRQRVLWVGLLYAVLAWGFIKLGRYAEEQASAQMTPPEWLMPVLVMILLIGFPIAVFFAWVQQLKFDGLNAVLDQQGTLQGMRTLLWSRRGIDMVLVTLVISVLAGFAFDLMPLGKGGGSAHASHSIAVLPFVGADDDSGENWLGKGMAEDLHALLAGHTSLNVSSISMSFRTALEPMKAQQIGHELDVQYLLRGLVVRGATTLRVRVYLIDSVTGLEVWSGKYDRDAEDFLTIQSTIANSILSHLGELPLADNVTPVTVNMAAYESYLRGRELLRNPGTQAAAAEAAIWFRQALVADERMPMAREGLCNAYVRELELGDGGNVYGHANSACAEAILSSPDSPRAHGALADFYRVTGYANEAIKEYQWVVERQAGDSQAWFGLARAYADTGSVADAEDAFRRVLEIKPDCADAHEAFVVFLLAEGRYEEALELSRRLVQLDNDRIDAYVYLANTLFMNGQFEAAIKANREVLSRDIGRHAAVLQIARSYYFMNQYDSAITIYRQAARLLPGERNAFGGLASAYAQLPDVESQDLAKQAFIRARQLTEQDLYENPVDVDAIIDLAYYCAALGDRICASRFLTEALRLAPEGVRTHYVAALVYASAGETREAGIATQRALALGYPVVLISTDPLLAALQTESRFAYLRFSALTVPEK